MLSIPFYRQKKPYTCGPAVLRMVFRYFGKTFNEPELAKALKVEPILGVRHHHLIRVARRNGFYSYVNHGSSLDELAYFIRMKLPPIVRLSARLGGSEKDEGHYAVVTAVTKRHVYLNDPWRGADFQMSVKAFLRDWKDNETGKMYERWAMVVSPKKVSVGRSYAPVSSGRKGR